MASEEDREQKMLDSISQCIREIQDVLRDCSTESVVRRCLLEKKHPRPDFTSPAKQISFLLGLLLATEEPADARVFNDRDWQRVSALLESLFAVYTERYIPDKEQFKNQPAQLILNGMISQQVFLDYYYKTLLTTPEDLRDRIIHYTMPFDDEVASEWGIKVSECLRVTDWIAEEILLRIKSYDDASKETLLDFQKITYAEVVNRYGKQGDSFWKLFTIGRGEGKQLCFPTDESPVVRRPFIRISDDIAYAPDWTGMLAPILTLSEDCLSGSINRNAYLQHRARTTEEHARFLFERILGGTPRIFQNLFETPDNQHEHDIIAIDDSVCLFIEVKSSPPPIRFRDPEKGFTRLLRDFRSDTGIQGAYNQALRLLKSVRANDITVLYDKDGNEALRLPREIRDNIFCICVARDSFGPLRGHLTSLLDKGKNDPYPWVVSTLELASMAEAWEYYHWDSRQLKAFLSFRLELQPVLTGDDELDFVGAYILNCGLYRFKGIPEIPTNIDLTYAYIFDVIHNRLRGQPISTRLYPTFPTNTGAEGFVRTGKSVLDRSPYQKRVSVGRNELCPCGSGVKFKRCHGML